MINRFALSGPERQQIKSLLQSIATRYGSAEDPHFLREVSLLAQELPQRLRAFFNDFRLLEPAGACVLAGYEIDFDKIGHTPKHWKLRAHVSPTHEEEIFLVLCGSLMGDVFGWATQQAGFLIHDVLPIKGQENEQLGTSSDEPLWWHTEDAFHSYRGDYLALMCLRNPDHVATTIATIDSINLEPAHRDILFQPRFTIRPDESHLEKNKAGTLPDGDHYLQSAYRRILEMNTQPAKLAVLYGDPAAPYCRIDPYFMDPLHDDQEAQRALDALIASLEWNLMGVVLEPGEILFIDNYRTVHGRKPFKARYDGNDRWLKRINITRDLRKSRDARADCASRIIC
jgi:Fe(II)/alpha-ketoglutarate-dependent arginine beta-hydroxylase